MKSVSVLFLLLLISTSYAQNPRVTQTLDFRWNWRDAQHLTGSDTVGTSKDISATDRALLLEALASQFKAYTNPRERAAETGAKIIDLNGDGVPEIICQAIGSDVCSVTGNCPLWIFQKTVTGYKLVLQADSVQNFTIQPTRSNGFLDLVLGRHESATEQTLFLARFRDGQYFRGACYQADWTYLGKDGDYHDSEEPLITPCEK
ncbi:MAG: hypothetical protein WCC87_13810 [Candidatus Korobacteraceae bacterium]